MAECIIARGGGGSSGTDLPPIVPGYSSILVTVRDSEGNLLPELSVHCKDGDNWYNYHTNNKGQVLFMTNSGSANITAWNFSINGNYKWIDQSPVTQNIDAPASSSNLVNMNLTYKPNFTVYYMNSSIYGDCFTGNYKVRASNYVNISVGGAGGSGAGGNNRYPGGGGGGGGLSISNSIKLNNKLNYVFYVGAGGAQSSSVVGSSGGSSSAFGIVANGGGYGSPGSGGRGGTGLSSIGGNGGDSERSGNNGSNGYGGGGGGGYYSHNYGFGGVPNGGSGGDYRQDGFAGQCGGGGGGGGREINSSISRGGAGGAGVLSFTFY